MASVAVFVGTVLSTFVVGVFHKPIGEISARILPFLYLENIESASKKVHETVEKVETVVIGSKKVKSKKEHVDVPVKVREVGDYIDSAWSDADVPRLAFENIEAVLDTYMDEHTAEKVVNTCKKLLAGYAMEAKRRKQFEKARDFILVLFPDLAKEIDMSLFSQCAFWEGKIALYR
jgi:hypothetical protein